MLLVSPAEPANVKRAIPTGVKWGTSSLCEQMGVDFLWHGHGGWCGVQRKEISDLLASAADGRLSRELQQVVDLETAVVVMEGIPHYTTEGVLVDGGFGRSWTAQQIMGLVWSIQKRGVWMANTKSVDETILYVLGLMQWSQKERHNTAVKRAGVVSVWGGNPDAKEFACHLLQGIPGVGPEIAAKVYDHFGRVPWRWDVTAEELMKIDGVGRKKAETMMRALRGKDGD